MATKTHERISATGRALMKAITAAKDRNGWARKTVAQLAAIAGITETQGRHTMQKLTRQRIVRKERDHAAPRNRSAYRIESTPKKERANKISATEKTIIDAIRRNADRYGWTRTSGGQLASTTNLTKGQTDHALNMLQDKLIIEARKDRQAKGNRLQYRINRENTPTDHTNTKGDRQQ